MSNSVHCNNTDMEELKKDTDDLINTQCTRSTHCTHSTYSIIGSDVSSTIRKLKHDNKKWWFWNSIRSYNLLRWVFKCSYCSLSYLQLCWDMGLTPDGILTGTMIPIPKGRWTNLSTFHNFRAITLSSIVCKMIDVVILTSGLRCGFKQASSMNVWTVNVK